MTDDWTQRMKSWVSWWTFTSEFLDQQDKGNKMTIRDDESNDGTWVRGSYGNVPETPDKERATDSLEQELKKLSERIAADAIRFQQVSAELKRRRKTKDEQPTPETQEQLTERLRTYEADLEKNLVLKIAMMEAEQAKLVVEAELFKSQRDEAEQRLALVAKHLGKQEARKPLSWDAARELLRMSIDNVKPDDAMIADWMITAVVEASK